ncbi:arginase family protein [Rubrobacter indicoceani]|uniref:arginase family protein n=1 Tax=Rubrobacter indicoceani TaxID=2051957 RepID=UPI0013C43AEB
MSFELDRLISLEVSDCLKSEDFPLVLSGNCNNAVGTMSGIGCEDLGFVWLDGHVDFNHPDATTTPASRTIWASPLP